MPSFPHAIRSACIAVALFIGSIAHAQSVTTAGQPAQLNIRPAGEHSIRITLKPVSYPQDYPYTPALAERNYPAPALSLTSIDKPVKKQVGSLLVEVRPNPLTVVVNNAKGEKIQELVFENEGNLSFKVGAPVLGMGEGGSKPEQGSNWRTKKIEFDRRGILDKMQPRWQADAYGSRNPVPMLIGTEGWGLFVAAPWVQVDLTRADQGVFIPWKPQSGDTVQQNQRNQGLAQTKGLPPAKDVVPGLYDVFVFDAHDPLLFMKDESVITGPAVVPPKWALGYMQSHRALQDDAQMMGVIDTFRTRKIPVDAVIYLGTGFTPKGWNTNQPSFDFNPAVFKRDAGSVISDMHDRHVKVVVHMVPWDRDKLPALQGSIPVKQGEPLDNTHIQNYWQQHKALMKTGVDAFWPDEGDWFNLYERIKRHQLYYQGPVSTYPNIRPWSLHRNGFLGIAQWGGWVWSGDTESSWKTLEGQIAVGINHSLSLSPFWGSDIGGFTPSEELTGELYARWFQFGAFNASFRSHGRTWRTRLPWGWASNEMGPKESRENPLQSEMNNPTIEPVVKQYDELHYQLMPYTYTLAWEARDKGLPMMRALWLYYPQDAQAAARGDQYLWGRDLLVAPVYTKGATSRAVYLPKGTWYDWWTNETTAGGQTISRAVDLATMPLYVRAGAIIPFDPIRQYTAEVVNEPTTLKIYSGADGSFTLYEDDGTSLDYLKGKYNQTLITWNDKQKKLRIAPSHSGLPAGTSRIFKLQLFPGGAVKTITYTGKAAELSL